MTNKTNAEDNSLTGEEIQKLSKFYDSNIPLLKKQKSFEELRADIEDARLRRTIAIYKMATIHHQAKAESENIEPKTNQDVEDKTSQ
jgi:hypothetical protein